MAVLWITLLFWLVPIPALIQVFIAAQLARQGLIQADVNQLLSIGATAFILLIPGVLLSLIAWRNDYSDFRRLRRMTEVVWLGVPIFFVMPIWLILVGLVAPTPLIYLVSGLSMTACVGVASGMGRSLLGKDIADSMILMVTLTFVIDLRDRLPLAWDIGLLLGAFFTMLIFSILGLVIASAGNPYFDTMKVPPTPFQRFFRWMALIVSGSAFMILIWFHTLGGWRILSGF
jgi:hypothetical protein